MQPAEALGSRTSPPRGALDAPWPARGYVRPGFEGVARVFAGQLRAGRHAGAAFAATVDGELAVDLWGGLAHRAQQRPWEAHTSCVVFSVTKGLVAMAMHLLAARGRLAWDAPVAEYWPAFGDAGKRGLTVRTLLEHRAGLAALEQKLTLEECLRPASRERVRHALESQRPLWAPGTEQGYHATTFGLYARELFERVAGEDAGGFLARELFGPLGAEVWVGTPPAELYRVAALEPPSGAERASGMLRAAARGEGNEARMTRALLRGDTLSTRAFLNPAVGLAGVARYGEPDVLGAQLLWASATATARGLATAYLPFALGGEVRGRRYFAAETLRPLARRSSWAAEDKVLHKPLGWTQGFLKEEAGLFSPGEAGFGHAGLGGALGWCDPALGVTLGYVPNKLDWRVRSPRVLELCAALWSSEPLRERRAHPLG